MSEAHEKPQVRAVIDIGPEVAAILRKLGHHPTRVRELVVTPGEARVVSRHAQVGAAVAHTEYSYIASTASDD